MTAETNKVLAGPIGDCCVQGVKHSGTPLGKTIEVDKIATYLSEPSNPSDATEEKRVILYFADVYGPFYLNAQLLADYYASQGFYVLGIDYFFGDPIQNHADEADFDREGWFKKSRKQAEDALPGWIDAVRKRYGEDAIYSAVGYCFGAPYVLETGATDKIAAGAFAHPAGLTEDHFRNFTKPLLLLCAETDFTFSPESRRRAIDILAEKKAAYHVQLFSGVSHGFATRGDPEVENTRWAKEEAARSVVRWFTRWGSSKAVV